MPSEMTKSYLAFTVRGVRLGLETTYVKEVLPAMQLLAPPEMPPLLRGFLRLRGALIPVIRLDLLVQGTAAATDAPPPMQLHDRLVVARLGGMETAWIASADMEPITCQTSDSEPLPEDHVLNNCARAVLPRTPPVILLEPDRLLLAAEKQRLEELQDMTQRRLEWTVAPSLQAG